MISSDRSPASGTRFGRSVAIALASGALLAAGHLAGCASEQPAGPREYLDERTAATITVAGESMVFAYDRPDLGVNARDYVTLTAVDVNTAGEPRVATQALPPALMMTLPFGATAPEPAVTAAVTV